MKNGRSNKGFTLMEVLVAVTILVILMGVAFVAVINHQRSMKRLELDQTAREIFVAAQNHLTMVQSQGLLEDAEEEGRGYQAVGASKDEYCLFVNGPDDFAEPNAVVLNLTLPTFSLDDTVRTGSSYVIRYNWKTATVRDVFYSDHSNLSNVTFSDSDYNALFDSPGYAGDDASKSQLRLDGYGGDSYDGNKNGILGWYGGADLKKAQVDELTAPSITIKNAEKLEVTLKLASISILDTNTRVQLIMHGDTSGVDKLVKEFAIADFPDFTNPSKTVYLDDITTADDIIAAPSHFAEQSWCQGGADNSIIPGENITLYARIYNNTKLVKETVSARKHTNSLFGSVVDEQLDDLTTVKTATISNIRHLENLYAGVSGYDPSKVGEGGKDGATRARQTSDLWWKGSAKAFCNAIAGKDGDADQVRIRLNNASSATDKQTFVPVSPDYALEYYGQNHAINGVTIDLDDDDSPAGLFGVLKSASTIQDLELVDCSVATTAQTAGMLLGKNTGDLKLKNLVVRDSDGKKKSAVVAAKTVGGLIGALSNGEVSIDACAASVLVKATGNVSVAGGLVGSATGEVSISSCYSGGHTKEGAYDTGAINVASTEDAGGLIGVANGISVSNCYATTSVSGGEKVGGLVGNVTGGSMENCYCTGLVVANDGADGAKTGAFAGVVSGVEPKGCQYFSIINEGMEAVPDAELEGIVAFDKTARTYNDFFQGTANAKPYDATLTNYYQDKFSFKTVKQLGGVVGSDDWVTTHYGDWPVPEVLVVNEKTT